MACYFRSGLSEFLVTPDSEVLSELTLGYSRDGFAEMRTDLALTWWNDIAILRETLRRLSTVVPVVLTWQILLEFTIPRKSRRLDVVLLTGEQIILLECKTSSPTAEDIRQVEEYALLLHYFHKPSDGRKILPIVVTRNIELGSWHNNHSALRQGELEFKALASYWIAGPQVCSWQELGELLSNISEPFPAMVDGEAWNDGAYFPTPTIIDAALALRTGLSVREVAHSEAADNDIEDVTAEIRRVIDWAKAERKHAICFLTGVPGSGKTLVGLSLAHLSESRTDAIHFMSGNGPLVKVLQEVFRRQAMQDGVPASEALIQAQTLIENVHVFAKNYTEKDQDRPPSNHVIIFDEAQRAWNLAQNLNKFKRNYSEPEMLLKIMERHEDWSCVVALVGGGQEINSGEAGLEEWGKALAESTVNWSVHASPEVLQGGISTAGHRLFDQNVLSCAVNTSDQLHLRTSNRSLRADKLAAWVNHVLSGDDAAAAAMRIAERFPLFLTRDLSSTRLKLRQQALGYSRFGLVGSSGSARLRADGLEPSSSFHAEYPWHHWYLAPSEDVRSSFRCEVFATEFEIQGLELDWIGLCWGGDFIWSGDAWLARDLRHGPSTRWGLLRRSERQEFRRNAYRVLLTRARQGMVVYVPRGDPADPTRNPVELDSTADFLVRCGVHLLDD